ncbi:hypothetical protein FF38_00224 [Lucilia cuprina]|uniref:Uncharacterized protein n=1 Tax=Lucilia cuprina TaxID=7375 RepID=A0A0L0BXL7_LUCCU|nr:hypothetical protein FF38_00224 [Lucilia cuprina]
MPSGCISGCNAESHCRCNDFLINKDGVVGVEVVNDSVVVVVVAAVAAIFVVGGSGIDDDVDNELLYNFFNLFAFILLSCKIPPAHKKNRISYLPCVIASVAAGVRCEDVAVVCTDNAVLAAAVAAGICCCTCELLLPAAVMPQPLASEVFICDSRSTKRCRIKFASNFVPFNGKTPFKIIIFTFGTNISNILKKQQNITANATNANEASCCDAMTIPTGAVIKHKTTTL